MRVRPSTLISQRYNGTYGCPVSVPLGTLVEQRQEILGAGCSNHDAALRSGEVDLYHL